MGTSRGRGRPKLRWVDSVAKWSGRSVEDLRKPAIEREQVPITFPPTWRQWRISLFIEEFCLVCFFPTVGAGSVARSTSAYIDSLVGNRIDAYMTSAMPMNSGILAKYPDFLAMGLCLVLASMGSMFLFNVQLLCCEATLSFCTTFDQYFSTYQVPTAFNIIDNRFSMLGKYYPSSNKTACIGPIDVQTGLTVKTSLSAPRIPPMVWMHPEHRFRAFHGAILWHCWVCGCVCIKPIGLCTFEYIISSENFSLVTADTGNRVNSTVSSNYAYCLRTGRPQQGLAWNWYIHSSTYPNNVHFAWIFGIIDTQKTEYAM